MKVYGWVVCLQKLTGCDGVISSSMVISSLSDLAAWIECSLPDNECCTRLCWALPSGSLCGSRAYLGSLIRLTCPILVAFPDEVFEVWSEGVVLSVVGSSWDSCGSSEPVLGEGEVSSLTGEGGFSSVLDFSLEQEILSNMSDAELCKRLYSPYLPRSSKLICITEADEPISLGSSFWCPQFVHGMEGMGMGGSLLWVSGIKGGEALLRGGLIEGCEVEGLPRVKFPFEDSRFALWLSLWNFWRKLEVFNSLFSPFLILAKQTSVAWVSEQMAHLGWALHIDMWWSKHWHFVHLNGSG